MTDRRGGFSPGGGAATRTELRWVCPYCERVATDGYTGEREAVAALRAHILAADGDDHGPEGEAPADTDRELIEYVRLADRATSSQSRPGER